MTLLKQLLKRHAQMISPFLCSLSFLNTGRVLFTLVALVLSTVEFNYIFLFLEFLNAKYIIDF